MKQSKVPKPSQQPPKPPAPAAPAGPRYRYYQTPPEKLSLRAGDLLTIVPDAYWVRGYNAEKLIDLPAAEVLSGPVPKVSVRRLAEIAPECFQAAGEDIKVALPISRLARVYALETHSEVIKEPAPLIDIVLPAIDDKKGDDAFAPKEPKDTLEDKKVTSRLTPFKLRPEAEDLMPLPPKTPEAVAEAISEPMPESKTPAQEPEKPDAPKQDPEAKTPAGPADSLEKTGSQNRPVRPFPPRRPEIAAPESEPPLSPPPAPAGEMQAPAPQPAPLPVQPSHPPAKTIFSMLPIFKRKAAPPPTPISTTPPAAPVPITKRARVELPPPKIHIAPPAPLSGEHPLPAGFTPPPPPPPVDPLPKPDTAPEAENIETPKDETAAQKSLNPTEETAKPVEPVRPPASETVPPPIPVTPAPEPIAKTEQTPTPEQVKPEPIKAEPAKVEPTKPEPPAPQHLVKTSPAVLVETEHLPKKGPDAVGNQDEIQSIFLTEEYLSVDRIVELCVALPGINSCVLSHGASVIASQNVPDSIDLVSLSAHALEMLRAMRESSAKMGIGAVPAVTIHSEKGPITFFQKEDLCLLVLHKDRGFIPGVREKLQQVIDALNKANLPKPLPSSHPVTLEG
ncbi:hypothetical protein DB345_05090 [Spartobacteria bacterium LR76]|nr:hypothetical protein DB345_05090 [Spartobacteria bacterium LR76]